MRGGATRFAVAAARGLRPSRKYELGVFLREELEQGTQYRSFACTQEVPIGIPDFEAAAERYDSRGAGVRTSTCLRLPLPHLRRLARGHPTRLRRGPAGPGPSGGPAA